MCFKSIFRNIDLYISIIIYIYVHIYALLDIDSGRKTNTAVDASQRLHDEAEQRLVQQRWLQKQVHLHICLYICIFACV
jgi:hypothetical protein